MTLFLKILRVAKSLWLLSFQNNLFPRLMGAQKCVPVNKHGFPLTIAIVCVAYLAYISNIRRVLGSIPTKGNLRLLTASKTYAELIMLCLGICALETIYLHFCLFKQNLPTETSYQFLLSRGLKKKYVSLHNAVLRHRLGKLRYRLKTRYRDLMALEYCWCLSKRCAWRPIG